MNSQEIYIVLNLIVTNPELSIILPVVPDTVLNNKNYLIIPALKSFFNNIPIPLNFLQYYKPKKLFCEASRRFF